MNPDKKAQYILLVMLILITLADAIITHQLENRINKIEPNPGFVPVFIQKGYTPWIATMDGVFDKDGEKTEFVVIRKVKDTK